MTDGLKDKHRAAIVAAVAANDRVERAVLFGSRATGTNTATSDVDIALFGDRLTLTDQAFLAAALDEIPMAQSVDLLLYDSIQSRILREHIRRQGIEWYARPPREEEDDTASDSGAEWPVVKLEEVSSDEPGAIAIGPFGSRMKSGVYTLSGVPVIRGTNISTSRAWRNEWVYVSDDFADGLPNCNVREGDLVFPHRGSIGEVAIIPGDRDRYMLSTSLMKFRPDPNRVSPLFLFYYFRSDTGRSEIMQYSSQVGTPGIGQPLTSLRQFQVPIPPREAQEHVADILSTLDDKIELNRQINQTLEAMARVLFKSWFVDFDPVHAKATLKHHAAPFPQGGSDWSVERARAYLDRMDSDIAALFPDRFVDSELGRIPEGWEGKALDEIAVFQNGLALQKYRPQGGEEGLPVVKIAQLRSGKADSGERATATIRPECVIKDGDVIFSWSGSLMVKVWCGGRAALNQHLFKVASNKFPKWFFLHWVRFHLANFQTIAAGKATTMGHIKRHHLSEAMCAVPNRQLLSAVNGLMNAILEKSICASVQSGTLATLRDSLLPKLISGELWKAKQLSQDIT